VTEGPETANDICNGIGGGRKGQGWHKSWCNNNRKNIILSDVGGKASKPHGGIIMDAMVVNRKGSGGGTEEFGNRTKELRIHLTVKRVLCSMEM